MPGVFSGLTRVVIDAVYRDTSPDLSKPSTSISHVFSDTWVTGLGQRLFEDTLELAVSTPQTIDLNTITDPFGLVPNFTTIRGILIKNKSADAGEDLEVSGDFFFHVAASGAFIVDWVDDAAKLTVRQGGTLFLTAPNDGYVVTADSADEITFDPAAKDFDVDVILWGGTA